MQFNSQSPGTGNRLMGPVDDPLLDDTYYITTVIYDDTNSLCWYNGGGMTAGSLHSNDGMQGPFHIGGNTGNGAGYDGKIAEILFYTGVLTEAQINEVGFGLQEFYGIDGAYIPEPMTLAVLAFGALALLRRRRR